MLNRALGAGLILIGGMGYGISLARALRCRVGELSEIINALGILEAEISFNHTPLPEALVIVAQANRRPVKDLFTSAGVALSGPERRSVNQTWLTVLNQWSVKSHLTESDLDILASLGPTLGSFGVSNQILTLKTVIARLQEMRRTAESNLDKRCQMRVYLGVAGGAALAILLI